MLTAKYRPRSFEEVVGSRFAIKLLTGICNDPNRSPRSLIFYGEPGTGKTSCARILPYRLNCKKLKNKKCDGVCVKCPCADGNIVYEEFNCAYFGSVKHVREIVNTVSCSFTDGSVYRVVVFDEVHLSSPEAQSALLEILEDVPTDVFFVFCTTDMSSLLPTIVSRSVEIEFDGASVEGLVSHLRSIASQESWVFSDELYARIALRSGKDVRCAVNRLQEASVVGEHEFLEKYVSIKSLIEELFTIGVRKDFDVKIFQEIVASILKNPVQYIRDDFEKFVVEKSNDLFVNKVQCSGKMELLISDWLKIQRNLTTRSDWNVFFNTFRRYAT